MLNIETLEELGRPPGACRVYVGERPLQLEEMFARVVADGWSPRSPAFGAELDWLQVSAIRGDCISPLLMAGDVVYLDPRTPAESGDIVSFKLSGRGADAQNSDLPAGQSPWPAGASWCKLLVRYRGFDMLLDRHGNAATATLMTCESPDELPILYPVRQVRRNGRLLFGPESFASQVGLNAATDVYSANIVSPVTTGTQTGVFSVTVAVPAVPYAHIAIVTMTCDAWRSAGGGIWVERDLHGSTSGGVTSEERFLTQSASPGERVTIQYEFPNAAGTAYDYNLAFNTLSPSNTITAQNVRMQVEIIKR